MSSISQFFGGIGGGFYQQVAVTASGSFTCPVAGQYLVTAIGGGAGGTSSGRGGCAGGIAQSLVTLSASDVITYTIGAGGAVNGGACGNTTCTATGLSLTANGGTASAG